MRILHSHRFHLWLRVLACFLVAMGTIEGGVLCFAEERHEERGGAQLGCCDLDREADGSLGATFQATPKDDCGPCVDVPLSATAALTRLHAFGHRADTPQAPAATLPFQPCFPASVVQSRLSPEPLPSSDSGLLSLRSIILLI